MSLVTMDAKFMAQELKCPEGKDRVEYVDRDLPGHYIEVRATSQNQGTHYYRRKDSTGRMQHTKIGRTTEISLSEARKKIRQIIAAITLNGDAPVEAKTEPLTLARFFEEHLFPFQRPRKRSCSPTGWRWYASSWWLTMALPQY